MEKEKHVEKQKFKDIVEKLDRDVDAAIVEGFSDRLVLEKLGFGGRIFESAERKLEDLAEDVGRGAEKVAVLTDFDSHGKEEAGKISRALQQENDVLHSAREEFGEVMGIRNRKAVEDIAPLLEKRWKRFTDATLDRLYFNRDQKSVSEV